MISHATALRGAVARCCALRTGGRRQPAARRSCGRRGSPRASAHSGCGGVLVAGGWMKGWLAVPERGDGRGGGETRQQGARAARGFGGAHSACATARRRTRCPSLTCTRIYAGSARERRRPGKARISRVETKPRVLLVWCADRETLAGPRAPQAAARGRRLASKPGAPVTHTPNGRRQVRLGFLPEGAAACVYVCVPARRRGSGGSPR